MKKALFCIFIISLFCNFQLFAQDILPYILNPGFYRIIDYPINIRSEPGLHGNIIGKLSLHDEIEVIENTNKMDYFENYSDYWYKIKINNIVGYIWGGYIAVNYFETDLDKNGQKDIIYIRYIYKIGIWKGTKNYYKEITLGNDGIIIYINNKKINVNIINEKIAYFWQYDEFYYTVRIIEYNNEYYLECSNVSDGIIFKINSNGLIDYLGIGGMEVELLDKLYKFGKIYYF